MIELFSALMNYSFMQHAFIACILSSIGCGVIGTYVVVKRVGFLAGGIAHTVLAGMGIAYFLEGSPLVGAVVAALFAAVFMSFVKLRWNQHEDVLVTNQTLLCHTTSEISGKTIEELYGAPVKMIQHAH